MLTNAELEVIKTRLGRGATLTEIAIFDAMWSEHCSYKSSKKHLKELYNKNDIVLAGPGENAGVLDFGDGDKIAFKVESHNHPSYIEPYQGAATGAGGIIRDIFTMGFRPIALTNELFFGNPADGQNKRIIKGVNDGLSDYGNCVGIPTVQSKTTFGDCYTHNPLVNALCVGWTNGPIITNIPKTTGDVYYVGAKTGQDGIGGAIMASETFSGNDDKRPTVQVGDPYLEKLLIEASLELFATGKVLAAQDMGAAGLTSSTTEIALRGGMGMILDLDNVPLRQPMVPWEIMLSESQERMLFVLDKTAGMDILDIFHKWDLDCLKIGELVEGDTFVVRQHGNTYCDIPLSALDPPVLDREVNERHYKGYTAGATKSELYEYDYITPRRQYDTEVMGNTVMGIHNELGLVKLPTSNKGVAIATRSHPSLCNFSNKEGVLHCVTIMIEQMKKYNITPMAMTNCLNFGNPENADVMGDFVESIETLNDCAKYWNLPIVSGNVSLYNETAGNNIMPTPVIGIVGMVKDVYDV
jgi:phosphoribosylformylglycinamidine synthase subunit PurL